jgi:hypothetical protein
MLHGNSVRQVSGGLWAGVNSYYCRYACLFSTHEHQCFAVCASFLRNFLFSQIQDSIKD